MNECSSGLFFLSHQPLLGTKIVCDSPAKPNNNCITRIGVEKEKRERGAMHVGARLPQPVSNN